MAGTADRLIAELAKLLAPITDRLTAGQVVELFADLGVPLPPDIAGSGSVTGAADSAVSALTALPAKTEALSAAIAADDADEVATCAAELLPLVVQAFTASRTLATQVAAAVNTGGGAGPAVQSILPQLPQRLVEFAAACYLTEQHPAVGRPLVLLGLIDETAEPADGDRPPYLRRQLRLDRLQLLLRDPVEVLNQVYHWGDPAAALDATLVLARLRDVLSGVGLPATVLTDSGALELAAFMFRLAPGAGTPTSLVLSLEEFDFSGLDVALPVGETWNAHLRGEGTLDLGATLRIEPPATLRPLAPAPGVDGELTVSFGRTPAGPGPIVLFGEPTGTRLTAASIQASVGAAFAADGGGVSATVVLDSSVTAGKLVIAFGGADGFLSSVLPATVEVAFDLGVHWSSVDGLTLRGGAGLAVTVPLAVTLGPLRLDRVDVVLQPGPTGVGLQVRVAGGIDLGPFAASVEGIGVAADLAVRDGNLGPVDLTFRFLPPTGLGLSVDAGPVSGGGFIRFDESAGRYAGLLALRLGVVAVQATGLLDTRMPEGQSGYALLVLMRASFPPIQLGFGFALSSVGGLLALNRQTDVDALRSRMASGAVGRILAPEDPVRNAPALLADLVAVFPPTPGVVVVGPTLQLSWAEMVRFDIGVFIELPGPRKIIILGSARAGIENPAGGKPYLQIRLDILGVLDFAQQLAAFDAVLIDSSLLQILDLTGGAAFRLSWGAEPYVVLSIGGFHPAYDPAPLAFPSSLTRIAMVRGAPGDVIYFRFEGYFAITTNTLQFGAAIEAIITLGPFNIRGFLSFDALIRFEPFHFQFRIQASVHVRWGSHNLGGLDLRGELSGPGPVVFHGRVSFEILWFEIAFEETFTLGSSTPPTATPVSSAVAVIAGELGDPANLTSSAAHDSRVAVEPATNASLPVISPVGQALWSQQRAPLDLLLQRVEGAPLSRPETVAATGPMVTAPESDWFAPGSFTELSDADALNRRAFERLHAGVRLGTDGSDDGPSSVLTVTTKVIRLPAPPSLVIAAALPGWLQVAIAGRIGATERGPVNPAVAIRDETWDVHRHGGGVMHSGLSQAQAHQIAVVGGGGGVAVAGTDHVASMVF
ncbi:DUF6603 domain-containing protein [Cellulomonas xiejunii]|uniref:DUF6603 domain-containing protein n=1 Tax=Cellulomonas xiejunii TaxID=2968083 RepID=UPI001D0E4DD3|nr:DUF6603 domain-containing protein [Cellulomonas xiejunii]